MSTLLEYRVRVRNAADTADALTVSSVRGDTLPYLVDAPSVDGSEFDPLTGSYRSGTATVRIADAITSGTSRVVTSQLEDATFRQQLPGRKAYVEEREDGGTWATVQAGIVTGLRLSSAAVWDLDIGDTTMATRNLSAFAPKRDPADFTKVEPLADYLARWPQRGCLAGGPVIGGFLGMADLGGWEMTVANSAAIFAGAVKLLSFNAGYAWPSFSRTTNPDDVAESLNNAAGEGSGYGTSPFAEVKGTTVWREIVVQVGSSYYTAAKLGGYTHIGASSAMLNDTPFFDTGNFGHGIHVNDPDGTLTVGAKVRVRVFDAMPSERCPIYWRGHPVDLAAKLCDEAGISYDTTEATATRQALGTSLTITVRITGSQAWASFTESVLYGPCGFSARTLSSGALAFFTTRILASSLPGVTITSADVPQDGTVLFDLAEPDAITKVTYEQQNLVPAIGIVPGSSDGRTAVARGTASASGRTSQQRITNPPLDGVTVQSVTVERTSGDSGAAVDKEQRYTIPGFLDTGSQRYEPQLVDAKAAEIFDRDGRGRLTGELQLLRTGAGGDVVLGQEIVVGLPAMPNHNKRLGDDGSVPGRCVQIVRLSPSPRGPVVKVKDSGPNAQPLLTLPTITLATGPSGNTVTATITNAATLNTAGYAVRLQWALASSSPASSAYSDVAYFPSGAVPTTAILLPTIPGGLTAYVQSRSEADGHRPSAWSTPVSLASVVMGAPSGLSVTVDATDGSRATVAWTVGSNAAAALTDIYLRLSTLAFADAIRMAAGLLAGTISYPLSGLIPGDSYIVSVVHRDAVTGATAKTEYTFTAGSTTRTLSAPTNPVGIVGSTDPTTGVGRLDGTYGLNVTAVELPGFVTFWEAVETGVGTGTYGSFTQVSGMVPSVSGGPTIWRGVSANALLRKQLKARHEAPGTNPSTYTSAVTLDAWGVVQSPPVASAGPSLDVKATPGSPNYTITYTGSGGTVELSIDGAAYSAAPASPITVARPGAGAVPKHYAFRISDGTQTIGNDVTIPSIDADTNTVTPDLVVVPGSETTTTKEFGVNASNPSGGAAPSITVTMRGTTGTGSTSGAFSDGVPKAAVSGEVITASRPSFGTTVQASITVTASLSGGGSETIQRTILNQVKTSFGPSLTAAVTYAATTASIAYVGSGGTVEVSINGGAYSAAAASPISVSRPAVGSLPTTYDFRITADGQTVSAHAEVVPIGFGPSLTVTATPGTSNYSIAYSGAGTITLAIDGGSYGSPAASPIVVSRTSSDHTYAFKSVLDGQTITQTVVVPASAGAANGPSITGINAYNADYPGDGGGGFDISWVSNNLSGDCTYDIAGTVTVGNTSGGATFTSTGNSGSPVHINTDLGPSAPSVRFTIVAKQDGVTVCTGIFPDAAVAL